MTPGQAAYETWRSLIFLPLPPWDAIPTAGQEGWEKVAQAAIEENRVQGRFHRHR